MKSLLISWINYRHFIDSCKVFYSAVFTTNYFLMLLLFNVIHVYLTRSNIVINSAALTVKSYRVTWCLVAVCLSVRISLTAEPTGFSFIGKVYNYFGEGYDHPPKRNHLSDDRIGQLIDYIIILSMIFLWQLIIFKWLKVLSLSIYIVNMSNAY